MKLYDRLYERFGILNRYTAKFYVDYVAIFKKFILICTSFIPEQIRYLAFLAYLS